MTKKDHLKRYREKRDFTKSPEPSGKAENARDKKIFVIQKHDASHLHYDLRLEIEGVLISWAVPKGPSMNPDEKRLAIETEPHPIAYADFEGIIPEGEYGAGTVMIWDYGTYDNLQKEKGISMQQSYDDGKIEFFLHGTKVEGGFVLIRTRMRGNEKRSWLLKKINDDYADKRRNPVSSQPDSAKTGRSLKQIAEKS